MNYRLDRWTRGRNHLQRMTGRTNKQGFRKKWIYGRMDSCVVMMEDNRRNEWDDKCKGRPWAKSKKQPVRKSKRFTKARKILKETMNRVIVRHINTEETGKDKWIKEYPNTWYLNTQTYKRLISKIYIMYMLNFMTN